MIDKNGELDIGEIAPKLAPLFDKSKRYKYYALHGGRFSTKSHTVAKHLICEAINKKCRILCTREIQKTIKDSVHRLLWDMVLALEVESLFEKTENEIRCVNGSFFSFRGLKTDPQGIKSAEGYDYCWIEEAENISADSWDNVIPTIRKEGSEFYIVWNDDTEFDEVCTRFVNSKRDDVLEIKINYTDIPRRWIPDAIRKEIEWDKANDYAKYEHIWLGKPTGYSGRIFPTYSDHVHVKLEEFFDIGGGCLAKCNCYMGIDPHRAYYPAIIWVARAQDDKIIVYNEFPTVEFLGGKYYHEIRNTQHYATTPESLSGIIKACDLSQFGAKILKRCADPRFTAENTDFIQALAPFGVTGFEVPPFDNIEVGRLKIQDLLAYDQTNEVTSFNCPGLYVCSHCHNMRRALLRHRWGEKQKKADGLESEEYKDFIDVLRYVLSIMPAHYIPPKAVKDERPEITVENQIREYLKA